MNDTMSTLLHITNDILINGIKENIEYSKLCSEKLFDVADRERLLSIISRVANNKRKIELLLNHKMKEMALRNILYDLRQYSPIVIKGFAQSYLLYGDFFTRDFGDIDIVVSKNDRIDAWSHLKQQGYTSNSEGFYTFGPDYHEIAMLAPVWGSFVGFELKWGSSAFRKDFWTLAKNNIVEVECDGLVFKTLNDKATLLHMLVNTYNNSEGKFSQTGSLRNYFEIAYWIMNKTVDWDWIVKFAKTTENALKVKKVLTNVCVLYPVIAQNVQFDNIISNLIPDYSLEIEALHSDFIGECNGEGMVNPYSLDIHSKVNNIDEAIYDYARFYKSWLYSKRNDRYIERVLLELNKRTKRYKYLDFPIYYCMQNNADDIQFTFEYPNHQNNDKKFEAIRMLIYDNWIDSLNLELELSIPINKKDGRIKIVTANRYIGQEYFNACAQRFPNDNKADIYYRIKETTTTVCVKIPKDVILNMQDVLYFEIKVMCGMKDDSYSYGALCHCIEYINHNLDKTQ